MVVIIAGGREEWVRDEIIDQGLEALNFNPEIDSVIQGGASGIDTCAKEYCDRKGISCEQYDADWDDIDKPDAVIKRNKFGKLYNAKAGSDRNALMAQDADALLVIWDGKSPGSKNMKTQMIAMGKKVHEILLK